MTFQQQYNIIFFFNWQPGRYMGDLAIGLSAPDQLDLPPYTLWFYRYMLFWVNGTVVYYFDKNHSTSYIFHSNVFANSERCMVIIHRAITDSICIANDNPFQFVCEEVKESYKRPKPIRINLKQLNSTKTQIKNAVTCQDGTITKDFLACGSHSNCISDSHLSQVIKQCEIDIHDFEDDKDQRNKKQTNRHTMVTTHTFEAKKRMNSYVLLFDCEVSDFSIHYTNVCDRVKHCPNNLDEEMCLFDECQFPNFQCETG